MTEPEATVERHLADDALADAVDAAQRRGEARLVRRLCMIRNCYAGDTVTEAAARVGVTQPTGSRWLAAWNDDGLEGLRPSFGGGRPSRLSRDQRDRLAAVLDRYPDLTAEEVRRLVEAAFDVSYTRRHAARLRDRAAGGDPSGSDGERSRGVGEAPARDADDRSRYASALRELRR